MVSVDVPRTLSFLFSVTLSTRRPPRRLMRKPISSCMHKQRQIYLNDSFDQGCTTFFLPSSRSSTMNAFPVKPAQGCALVFPHGDSRGSLLHEGSPVGHGGAKYVIRTEVLYDAYDAVPEGVVGGKEGEVDEGVTA